VKNEVTKVLMNVRVQSGEQLDQAADDLEERGERISNVTYSGPDESGAPQLTPEGQRGAAGAAVAGAALEGLPRVGRNDPCPCGSGKKYKQCHGKLA
ncbi:MAG: preprotein translocase subunit SecA, partial [Acidovorax sp.]